MIDWRIIAAAAFVITVVFAGLMISRANLHAELATAHAESAALRIDNADFKSKVEQQNHAILQWQTAAQKRAQQIVQAQKKANQKIIALAATTARLRAMKSGADGCTSANNMIDLYLHEAK